MAEENTDSRTEATNIEERLKALEHLIAAIPASSSADYAALSLTSAEVDQIRSAAGGFPGSVESTNEDVGEGGGFGMDGTDGSGGIGGMADMGGMNGMGGMGDQLGSQSEEAGVDMWADPMWNPGQEVFTAGESVGDTRLQDLLYK